MTRSDTIAAIATAPGRAAIGIVRVSGPQLSALVDALVNRPLPARRAVLCEFRDRAGTLIDEGVAIRFPAPHSYTGEDVLELHAHGGPVVLRLLLKRCLELGARVAEAGEFTRRAFLNDKIDLAQAEGVIDLIDAATERAARCAARSLNGDFSVRIQYLTRIVVDLRIQVEAGLDFPEEDLDAVTVADAESRLRTVADQIKSVLEASRQGSLLREGMDVVLAGQPNVGKSSLLNRLAGEDLAIVTEIPGTTRDAIRQVIDLEGIPLRITDTAGLRASTDRVEAIGIARSWEAIAKADLILLLVDARQGETAEDQRILDQLPEGLPCLRVMNKVDLTAGTARIERASGATSVWLSAKTGTGLDLLLCALQDAIGWRGGSEGLYMARERHLQALVAAQAHAEEAGKHLRQPELVAEGLRLIQVQLATITGEFTADDLLGEIFSRFCIGK
jgi:tRNA modification GTPase